MLDDGCEDGSATMAMSYSTWQDGSESTVLRSTMHFDTHQFTWGLNADAKDRDHVSVKDGPFGCKSLVPLRLKVPTGGRYPRYFFMHILQSIQYFCDIRSPWGLGFGSIVDGQSKIEADCEGAGSDL